MKSILLLSPVPATNESSGITIRIDQLKQQLANMDFRTKIKDSYDHKDILKYDFFYAVIGSKTDSISSIVAKDSLRNNSLIIDLYTPIFLEKETTLSRWNPLHQIIKYKSRTIIRETIKNAGIFLVANKRQKKYWIKTAKSLGVQIPEKNIFTVPTGANGVKKPLPDKRDTIIWFGAIYPWFDPKPLIKAFSKISGNNRNLKLRFIGGFHPKTGYKHLYNQIVSEVEGALPAGSYEFVPWQTPKNLSRHLKDVLLAVHLPKETPEDYFSHRVRLLTLLNSGIPILTSGRDYISEILVNKRAGVKVSNSSGLDKQLSVLTGDRKKINFMTENALKIQEEFLSRDTEIVRLKEVLGAKKKEISDNNEQHF